MDPHSIARRRPRRFDGSGSAEIAIFTATEALLSETSLQDITVARILECAKLSRANFYHYFASKYDVIAAMVARLLADTDQGTFATPEQSGRSLREAMRADLPGMIDAWSERAGLIDAVVENMHVVPQLSTAWELMLDRFVDAVARQIDRERERSDGDVSAAMIAAVLVRGYERTFFVGSRGFDPRLPTPHAAADSLIELASAAVHGDQRPMRRAHRKTKSPKVISTPAADLLHAPVIGSEPDHPTATAILDATGALLAEHTMDKLSVAVIIERAAISRATFYFYFENKDDVFTALFRRAAAVLTERFGTVLTADRSDPALMRSAVAQWLELEPAHLGVLRSAVHEWPRRPGLREYYLDAMARMTTALEEVIDIDRAAGLAVSGPPAPQLAAVLMWTIERTIAGSLAGESQLSDTASVTSFLGALLVSAVYGR